MRDKEYKILKSLLEKNRQLFKKGEIKFIDYLNNHEIISNKLKQSILSMEEIEFLSQVDEETCLNKFTVGINMLKLHLN